MATYLVKRTIFLSPTSASEGVKGLGKLPNRVTLSKGSTFEGALKPSQQDGVNNILSFSYGGFNFEKPYGGNDTYAKMNMQDIVLADSPEAKPTQAPTTSWITEKARESRAKEETTKSMGEIFKFKDKLHAGVTLVGVAFGLYYAYKTKGKIMQYVGYTLGAGALGYIVGGVASSFASSESLKSKREAEVSAEVGKPLK
jgi:hypothetical protein